MRSRSLPPRSVSCAPSIRLDARGAPGEWRVRTGDFRIVYEIHDHKLVVLVVKVGHRRDVYERR